MTRIPGVRFVQGRNDYEDADGKHYGIAIHNTSNNASDENEAAYASRRTDGISSHLYCDHDSVTQSLELEDRAGHAGSYEGNQHSIAVEITGANGWSRGQWLSNVAWDKLASALAWVINNDPDYRGFEVRRASISEMKSNPKVQAFYGHDDMRRAWGGTTHTDPGPNFPWDHLLAKVKAAVSGKEIEEKDLDAKQDQKQTAMNTRIQNVSLMNPVYKTDWAMDEAGKQNTETNKFVQTISQIDANAASVAAQMAALITAVGKLADQEDVDAIVEAVKAEGDKAAARAIEDQRRDAEILAAVESMVGGGATAEQVLVKLGEMLTGSSPTA